MDYGNEQYSFQPFAWACSPLRYPVDINRVCAGKGEAHGEKGDIYPYRSTIIAVYNLKCQKL